MHFSDVFITNRGLNLISQTLSNPSKVLSFGVAMTTSTNTDSYTDAQMRSIDLTTFATRTSSGYVTQSESSTSNIILSIELNNETYNGVIQTLGVWAKIEGDDSTNCVFAVARVGAGHTPVTVPSISTEKWRAEVNLTLVVSDRVPTSISAPDGYYASAQNLNDLANRVVTTHKADSINVGDSQTILGKKSFRDGLDALSALTTDDILPLEDGDYNIGSSSKKYSSIWAYNIHAITRFHGVCDEALVASDDDEGNYIPEHYVNVPNAQTITGEKTFSAPIKAIGGVSFETTNPSYSKYVFESTNGVNSESLFLKSMQPDGSNNMVETFSIEHKTYGEDGEIESVDTIPSETLVWSLGDASHKLLDVYAQTFNGNATSATSAKALVTNSRTCVTSYYTSNADYGIRPLYVNSATNKCNIGTSSYKFENVYANRLIGKADALGDVISIAGNVTTTAYVTNPIVIQNSGSIRFMNNSGTTNPYTTISNVEVDDLTKETSIEIEGRKNATTFLGGFKFWFSPDYNAIIPYDDGSFVNYLGTSGNQFTDVYSKKFSTLPKILGGETTSATGIMGSYPGFLRLLCVKVPASSTAKTYYPGTRITDQLEGKQIYLAGLDQNGNTTGYYLATGTWITLSVIKINNLASQVYIPFLAIYDYPD